MNYLRTTLLLAALTALFMGIGYLFGSASGALLALLLAAGVNFTIELIDTFKAHFDALHWMRTQSAAWIEERISATQVDAS